MNREEQKFGGFISKASLYNFRVPPRKARLVVNIVRGKRVDVALNELLACKNKTAPALHKLIMSAAANASDQSSVDIDDLIVKCAWVDEGRVLKRFMPRAQGRATPIRKRSSHITVVLDEVA